MIAQSASERQVLQFFDDAIENQNLTLNDERIVEIYIGDQFVGLSASEFHAMVNTLHRQHGDKVVSSVDGAMVWRK